MTIGARIRAARTEAGITQAVLAARVNVSVTTCIRWETNTSRPRSENVTEIAKATGKSSSYFLGPFDDPDDEEPAAASDEEDEHAARLAAAKLRVSNEIAALLVMIAADLQVTA